MLKEKSIDTLVLAIIQHEDADAAIHTLNGAGFAVTLISSVGGFLGASNVTLLIGLQVDDVERALGLLKTCCHQRTARASKVRPPMETIVSGATIFVFPVTRYVHLGADHAIVDPRRPRRTNPARCN